MANPKIVIDKDPAKAAADQVNEWLARYTESPVLFLIAGGSSRAVLDYVDEGFTGPDTTITVTDDRYSKELDENNFALLQSTSFYNKVVGQDVYCINTEVWGDETQEDVRAKFEKNIREWRQEFPKGKIIAIYGVGEDGHTAGILPGAYSVENFKKLFEGENLVASVDAKGINPHPLRITTTFTFMRDWVDHAVFYVEGKGKQKALTNALNKGAKEETPARVLQEMKDVVVVTNIDVKQN